jgi:cbb3-type cytochrome oxidase maturation protein
MTFLKVWVIYAVFGISLFSAVFVWAVRNRQFSDLERGRHIALRAEKIIETEDRDDAPGRVDRLTWLALALIAFALLGSGLWLGLRSG